MSENSWDCETTNVIPLIYKKMSEVMRDISSVKKDQKNVSQGFKFRGIDQFVNALYPALTKHGVFMAPQCVKESHELKEVTRSNGKAGIDKHVSIQMQYTFWAEDGSNVVVGPIPAEGLDSGDKATNKALSAALKYALIQTFSIPTEDMAEADLDSPEIGTTKNSNSLIVPTLSGTLVLNTTGGTTNPVSVDLPGQTEFKAVKKSSFKRSAAKEENAAPKEVAQDETSGWEN